MAHFAGTEGAPVEAARRCLLMSDEMVDRVLAERLRRVGEVGVEVQDVEATHLLGESGACLRRTPHAPPESLVQRWRRPHAFDLVAADGSPAVHYGEDRVHSIRASAVHVLDGATHEHRNAVTQDLVDLVKVADMLPEYAAQARLSTARMS
jgi:trimethylamine:corrinoid methyltransferase-like protein